MTGGRTRSGQRPTASARLRRQQSRVQTEAEPVATSVAVAECAATTLHGDTFADPAAPAEEATAGDDEPDLAGDDEPEHSQESLVDLTDEEEPPARVSRRNRVSEVDVTGLSDAQAKQKVSEFKKMRAREYRKRYKEKRKARSEDVALATPKHFRIKTLDEVQSQNEKGMFHFIEKGDAYESKPSLVHEICELAETLCLTVRFPRNTKFELVAISEDYHGTNPRPLHVHASFVMSESVWEVQKIVLSGAMGLGPQIVDGKVDPRWRKNQARTAFTEDQLAWHAREAIHAQPSFSRASFVALFSNILRFPEHIHGDVWARVRREAYYFTFGVPNDNLSRLPSLKAEMQKYGHDLDFETIDGKKMVACVLSMRKSECDRRRRAAANVPATMRTPEHLEDLLPWPQQRAQFEATHADFLEDIFAPDANYINYLAFCFSFIKNQFVSLLKFVSADACFGKLHLDAFQVFNVCGVTSNGNVVSLGYVLISGNESEETWTRAWSFFQSKFSTLDKTITVVTDGDKGIPNALETVFGGSGEKPFEIRCSKHRSESLRLRHEKAAQTEFWRCARAHTLPQIERIRASPTYLALSSAACAALDSVADKQQYPAAAAASRALLYGRDSNQLREVDNNAIGPARSLDPALFVLWHCERACRLYNKFYHESRDCAYIITPHAMKRLENIRKAAGVVHPITAEHTSSHQAFNVIAGEKVHTVRLRVPAANDINKSHFPEDKLPCTCGVPTIEHMPCGHMLAVADQVSLNFATLVPLAFSTTAWIAQYPDVNVYAPTIADVQASPVPSNDSLRNPVAAPPKRGRPAKRRMRGVMERIVKRARLNSGR